MVWKVLVPLAGVVVLVGYLLWPPGPAATMITFYESVEAGRLDAALDLVVDEFVAQLGREKLRSLLVSQQNEIRGKGGIRAFDTEEERIAGDSASVTILIVYNDDSGQRDSTTLRREGLRWRIVPSK